MSYRITSLADERGHTIKVEGRLSSEGVAALKEEIRLAPDRVRLDLTGLMSADPNGLHALLNFSVNGAKLRGASAYIRQLLDEASGSG